jgi:hypothetical protein
VSTSHAVFIIPYNIPEKPENTLKNGEKYYKDKNNREMALTGEHRYVTIPSLYSKLRSEEKNF